MEVVKSSLEIITERFLEADAALMSLFQPILDLYYKPMYHLIEVTHQKEETIKFVSFMLLTFFLSGLLSHI